MPAYAAISISRSWLADFGFWRWWASSTFRTALPHANALFSCRFSPLFSLSIYVFPHYFRFFALRLLLKLRLIWLWLAFSDYYCLHLAIGAASHTARMPVY
jgi:hypothetical protein